MKSRLINWNVKMMAKSKIILWSVVTIVLVATMQFFGCNEKDDPPAGVTILGLAPSGGRSGDEITIKGSGFEEGMKVFFSENKEAGVKKVTETSIVVIVPAGAVTGPVTVKAGDGREATSKTPFTILPPPAAEITILNVEPSSGKAGNTVTINGNGFEEGMKVFFSENKEAEVASVAWSKIDVIVPAGVITGLVAVKANDGRVATSGAPFTVLPPATITSVSPLTAGMCDIITITGTNFSKDVRIFTSDDVELPIESVTKTKIKAIVVGGANGVLTLKEGSYSTTSSASLTIDNTPVIHEAPQGASKGGDITLTGGFSTVANDIKVVINDVEYAPKTFSVFSLTVAVPAALQIGDVATIKVRNTALSKTSEAQTFKVYTVFDDFNRADVKATSQSSPNPIGAGWNIFNETWQIKNKEIYCKSGGTWSYMNHNDARCSGLFKVEADVKMEVDETCCWSGIVFNFVDDRNFYFLRICGIVYHFICWKNGDVAFIAGGDLPAGYTWYHLEVASTDVANKFHVKITQKNNGQVVHDLDITDDASDGSLLNNNGYAGFYAGSNEGYCDNFGFSKFD